MAKYTCNGDQPLGIAAASPIHNGIVGSERRNSITRWVTASNQPPKYPAAPPMMTPRIRLISTPTRPTDNEICVP